MGKEVIIVGGGIVGLSCAYYLNKAGHQVRLFDAGNFSSGASHMNAGYLTPSHIVPLAAPGMIQKRPAVYVPQRQPFLHSTSFALGPAKMGVEICTILYRKTCRTITSSHPRYKLV